MAACDLREKEASKLKDKILSFHKKRFHKDHIWKICKVGQKNIIIFPTKIF